MKIKITEFFPGARTLLGPDFEAIAANTSETLSTFLPGQSYGLATQQPQHFGMLALSEGPRLDQPGNKEERYYTIQRVNGNGGNGKGDGVAGPHKHTLEESDRVKKNSIQRHFLKEEKQKKKSQVRITLCIRNVLVSVTSEVFVQAATHCTLCTSYLKNEAMSIYWSSSICGHCLGFLFHRVVP